MGTVDAMERIEGIEQRYSKYHAHESEFVYTCPECRHKTTLVTEEIITWVFQHDSGTPYRFGCDCGRVRVKLDISIEEYPSWSSQFILLLEPEITEFIR